MPTKRYALETAGPERLEITWGATVFSRCTIRLDGQSAILLILLSLVLTSCGQQGSAAAPTPTPTPTPPTHWTAQATQSNGSNGSWSFTFMINLAGTAVDMLNVDFPANFLCGRDFLRVPPDKENFTGPWPITNGQFTVTGGLTVLPGESVTINGTINQATRQATGTWTDTAAVGGSCSGNWTAAPS